MPPSQSTRSHEELLRENRALRRRIAELEARLAERIEAPDPNATEPGGGNGTIAHESLQQEDIRDIDTESAREFLYKLPHGFEEIDLSGRIVWCNPARERLLGQSRDEIVGAYAWERLPGSEEAQKLREFIEHLARDEPDPEPLFVHAVHLDGRLLHLRVDWNYKRDHDGRATGFLVLIRDITEETRTKLTLEKTLAQFQGFMEHFPGAAFMKDREGRYILVNPITAKILGAPAEEILGKTDHEVLPAETAELLRRNDLTVLESGESLRTLEEMQVVDGMRTFLVVKFSVLDDDNEPRVAGMALDMTQRMREEKELERSRNELRAAGERLQLLSSAIEQSSEGVAILRPDRRIEFANAAFAGMHGLQVFELAGLHFRELFADGQVDDLEQARKSLVASGEFRGELWHRTPEGESFPCHESHSLVRDEDGDVIAHVIVARDVSEAVAAEKRLQDAQAMLEQRVDQRTSELADAVQRLEREIRERRRAERELERVWDSTLELLALMGPDGRLIRVNRTFERTLRVRQSDVVGRHFIDLVAPEDRERAHRHCAAIRESRPAPRFTVRYRVEVPGASEPELRWLEWAVTPVEDTELVYAAARDVTELRNFEERVARQQAELAHASRLTSMGEMASGIAHELNQPLGAISLRAEACRLALQRSCPDQPQLDADLDYVRAQAERAGEIIRRLRGFVARREPESRLVRPARLIQDVLHFVEHECQAGRIQLELEVSEELPEIDCDEIQIQQVILNLVRNAMEALSSEPERPEDPRCVQILGQLRQRGEAPFVEIGVLDNGPGLSPEMETHLFDPFFSTKSGGLGIGLSLSKSIVESHGGSLLAHSRDPRGMCFVLSLPVRDGPARSGVSRFSGRSQRTEGRA